MTQRAKVVAALVAALGVGSIVGGNFVDDGYYKSVSLEIGAALLLAAPLFLLERLLEARVVEARNTAEAATREVAEVREEVRRTAQRLDDLASQTRSQVEGLTADDAALYDAFREDVSADTVRELLLRGQELGAISDAGVRVQVPLMYDRLRFSPGTEGQVVVTHEELDGQVVSTMTWNDDESASQLLQRVAVDLQKHNRFPGENAFDGAKIMSELLRTVQLPLDARRRGSTLDLSPVIELFGDQWAVTVNGLECLEVPYWVPHHRLEEKDFRPHVMEKTWVNKDDLHMAWSGAEALHLRRPPKWLIDQRDAEPDI